MKVLVGPMVCQGCRESVWLAHRRVSYLCPSHGRVCTSLSLTPALISEDGTTHDCPLPRARAREIIRGEETVWTSAVTIEYAAPAVPASRLVPTPGAALRLGKD